VIPWDGDAGEDAHDGGEHQHQAHHHSGKVHREHTVQDDEDVVIRQPAPQQQQQVKLNKNLKRKKLPIQKTVINCLSYFACLSME
jgi:hypothetical protein